MTATLAFVDTETTGLDPRHHEVWEVALILRTEDESTAKVWQLPVDLARADSVALSVGHFYERSYQANPPPADANVGLTPPWAFAREFAVLTHGAYLIGAVPAFDDGFLKRLLRMHHQCPGWNYHLVDVEALAAGYLAALALEIDADPAERLTVATPPWSSNELSKGVGVDPEQFDRHTAFGDALWAMAIYDAVTSRNVPAVVT